ncbi:MAG: hypothetical protein ACYC4U_11310 [Pirellulaceae bacterium]
MDARDEAVEYRGACYIFGYDDDDLAYGLSLEGNGTSYLAMGQNEEADGVGFVASGDTEISAGDADYGPPSWAEEYTHYSTAYTYYNNAKTCYISASEWYVTGVNNTNAKSRFDAATLFYQSLLD